MLITCVICGDLCMQSDDISAAPCGHTFHSVCLIQWIEISKSCPQCRQSTTEKTILKLFFEAGSSDYDKGDPDTFQHQRGNLNYKILLRDQAISMNQAISIMNQAISKVKDDKTLSMRNEDLREECKSLKKSLKVKDTTNLTLKSQLKFMEQINSEAQKKAKENAEAMRRQLSLLQKELQKSRDETSGFIALIKELTINLKNVCALLSSTEQSKKLLETDVLSLERENASLRKKVDALQSAIASPAGNVKNSALHRLMAESPGPSTLKRPQTSEDEDLVATPEVVRKLARLEAEEDEDLECQGGYSQGASQVSSSPQKKPIFLHGRKPLADKTYASRKSHHNIAAKNKPSMLNVDINQLPNRSSQPDSRQIGYNGRPWRSCKKKV